MNLSDRVFVTLWFSTIGRFSGTGLAFIFHFMAVNSIRLLIIKPLPPEGHLHLLHTKYLSNINRVIIIKGVPVFNLVDRTTICPT